MRISNKVLAISLSLVLLLVGMFTLSSRNVDASSVGVGPTGNNALRVYPGPGVGEVTLEWQRASTNGENYSIWYGTQLGNYPYSADHIGYVTTYTIGNLTPGTRYYFGLQPIWVGNALQDISGVVTAVAPRVKTTVVGTAGPIGRNMLTAKAGPKTGQVTLSWNKFFADTQGYNIVYGDLPGNYIYGVLNAVTVNSDADWHFSYTVGALKSGKRYYFALVPIRASVGGAYITTEVSQVAR